MSRLNAETGFYVTKKHSISRASINNLFTTSTLISSAFILFHSSVPFCLLVYSLVSLIASKLTLYLLEWFIMPFYGNFHSFLFIKRAYSFNVLREQIMVKHAGLEVIRPRNPIASFYLVAGDLREVTWPSLTLQFPPVTTSLGWFWAEVLRGGLGTWNRIYECKWCYQPMKIYHAFSILCEEYHLSKIWIYFSKTYKPFPCVCFPT